MAPQKKVDTNVMVVEGWIGDYALEESLLKFRGQNYHHMFVTGGPLNYGYYLTNYKSTADAATATLLLLGASPDSTTSVSRKLVWRDRTYQSAVALKEYLKKNYPEIKSFNLVSQGAHAARSWLLFKMAMPEYKIGVISIDDKLFDQEKWWRTSKGFRTIVFESLGYIYVRFFFTPY